MSIFEYIRKRDINKIKELNYDINERDISGMTGLILASGRGEYEIVEFLVKSGTDLNIQNNNGYTALMLIATWMNSYDMVKFLLESGADPKLKNNDGKMAYEIISYADIKELLKPK